MGDYHDTDNYSPITYREAIGKIISIDFKEFGHFEIIIKSDSSYHWKSLIDESEGDEESKTMVLDVYRIMTNWINERHDSVSVLFDFKTGKIIGFITSPEFQSNSFSGMFTVED